MGEIVNSKFEGALGDISEKVNEWGEVFLAQGKDYTSYTKGFIANLGNEVADLIENIGNKPDEYSVKNVLDKVSGDIGNLLEVYNPSLTKDLKALGDYRESIEELRKVFLTDQMVLLDASSVGSEIVFRGRDNQYIKGVVEFVRVRSTSVIGARIDDLDLSKMRGYSLVPTTSNVVTVDFNSYREKYIAPTLDNLLTDAHGGRIGLTEEEKGIISNTNSVIGNTICYNTVVLMKNFGYPEGFIQSTR